MTKFIRINKKKFPIQDGNISEWTLKELVDKARQNTVTMEQMTVQSIAQHWLQNDKFRQSDPDVLNTLMSLAYEFGYDAFKIANGKIKVVALNEERRKEVAPGEMQL
jgi:hypothetical protein